MADIRVQTLKAVEQRVIQEMARHLRSNTLHEIDIRTILFNVFAYLTERDILNCRLACEGCSYIIEDVLENYPSWENLANLNPNNWEEPHHAYLPVQQHLNACRQLVQWSGGPAWSPESKEIGPLNLFGIEAFNAFCEKISRDPLNTRLICLGRPVHLNPDTEIPSDWQTYWSNAGRKIQAFSESICHIRMDINWFSAESRAIGSLWAIFILARMPQVKSIYMMQYQSPYKGKHSKRELNYIRNERMPTMENLTSLTLEVDGRGHRKLRLKMDCIMARLISEYCPVLKKLVILQKHCDADLKVVLKGNVFGRLEEFKVKVAHGDSLNGVLDKLNAPLVSKLSVEIEKLPSGEDLISTFTRLHTNMTNLQYIQLKVNDILTNEHAMWLHTFHCLSSEVLTVGSVKTLEVYHHNYLNYHALFMCLPNLEYLHIWGSLSDVKNKGEANLKENMRPKGEMWFADWLLSGRLNEYAPLWTKILPKLKVVTFNVRNGPCKKYTRDEYVKIMKKMEQLEMSLKKNKIM